MSYEPTNWQAGDTVTSAKLNKMEQGIANGGIRIIHAIDTGEINETTEDPIMHLDITPNDLENILNNGQLPMLYVETSDGYKMYISFSGYIKQTNTAQYECIFGMDNRWLSTSLDEYFISNQGLK